MNTTIINDKQSPNKIQQQQPQQMNTKLHSINGELTVNDLLLSTSVPIKIGGEHLTHSKDAHKNRIRFGLSALKTTAIKTNQTPKRNKIDRNYNNKSMESLHLNGSTESNNLKNKQYSTESLPANCYDEHLEFKQDGTKQNETDDKTNGKFCKQTTIDYYV